MMKSLKELNIKGLVFAFIVSFFIWIYSSLNSEYVTFVKVPLLIEVPSKWSLAGRIPDRIEIQILATGWQILNLSFFPKSTSCLVQISEEAIEQDKKILITKDDFQKGLILSASAKVLDIRPASVMVDVGTISERVVPIIFSGEIYPRENFVVIGKPILQPDAVIIRGRSEILENIFEWKTKPIVFNDVFHSFKTEIQLLDTLHSLISLARDRVNLIVDVDLIAEEEIIDIPVKVEDENLPIGHKIEPKLITIVVRSGVNRLSELDLSSLEAKVKYNDLINDTLGILIPQVKLPYGVELLQMDPPYLYHWRTQKVSG